MKPIHVGTSPLTHRIFAGNVLKDGYTLAANKQDVTGAACGAVAEHVLGMGGAVTVSCNGKQKFEIVVRDLTATEPERSAYRSQALDDVLAERRRQIEVEGWTPEHDDEHKEGEMAVAAGYYALQCGYPHERESSVPTYWPWDAKWWKPRDKRRNMIKSVALGLAEIERMDRAERIAGDKPEGE